ncbi:hypothetical protein KEM56_002777 [Ascosphaera pollenicola]|nr:hypothetical protein KEM56_002777 [Ascosphaera pollenicola]
MPSMEELLLRYKQVQVAEKSKDNLIHDLFAKLSEPQPTITELRQEFQTTLNNQLQLRDLQIANELEQLAQVTSLVNRESLIYAIIDGDGTIFSDKYLSRGEEGGKEAGNALWTAVTVHCGDVLPVPSNTKIITRIYANIRRLAEKCHKAGIVSKPSVVEDFVRGFNDSSPSFDFIDAGTRDNAAYEKILDNYNTASLNCHTRLIILGGSHDDSYAHLLEDVQVESLHRVSLLEAIPCSPSFGTTKHVIGRANFGDLFRTLRLPEIDPHPTDDFDRAPGAGMLRRPSTLSQDTCSPNTTSSTATQATAATANTTTSTVTATTIPESQPQQQQQQQEQQEKPALPLQSQQPSPATARVAT